MGLPSQMPYYFCLLLRFNHWICGGAFSAQQRIGPNTETQNTETFKILPFCSQMFGFLCCSAESWPKHPDQVFYHKYLGLIFFVLQRDEKLLTKIFTHKCLGKLWGSVFCAAQQRVGPELRATQRPPAAPPLTPFLCTWDMPLLPPYHSFATSPTLTHPPLTHSLTWDIATTTLQCPSTLC